ncbi:hypothetical protein, partial [Aminobacter sp. MET-1]|uniref:hypothetical protein n=1 Tax=Aminobacter sp. MET-1 TaxID=2951085 RepID=UPI00226A6C54
RHDKINAKITSHTSQTRQQNTAQQKKHGPQIATRPVQRRPPPRDPRQKLNHQPPRYPSNQTSRQQRA